MNLIFDLDGTLTDPFVGISRCIRHALDRLNLPAPDDLALRAWIGPPLKRSFERYFAALGVAADADQAVACYRERFATVGLYENRLYAGIDDLLAQCVGRGCRLFVATAKPAVYAQPIVAHFGLAGHFDAVYGSELDGRYTDKDELLAHLIHREALQPSRSLMIGDRHHDLQAAARNRVTAVGVLWGYGSEAELSACRPASLAADPAILRQVIESWLAGHRSRPAAGSRAGA